jgi:hypothetical protein
MRWLIAVAVLVPACFNPHWDRPACSSSGTCPDDLQCTAGYCEGAFDPAQCPASYSPLLPGSTRYRLLTEGGGAWKQIDICNNDLPGATHLVILETNAELKDAAELLRPATNESMWVGGVQRRSATAPKEAWIGFDSAPIPDLFWASDQPDDTPSPGGSESLCEQFAQLMFGYDGLVDNDLEAVSGALCECDGKALSDDVIATIEANRSGACVP